MSGRRYFYNRVYQTTKFGKAAISGKQCILNQFMKNLKNNIQIKSIEMKLLSSQLRGIFCKVKKKLERKIQFLVIWLHYHII